MGADQQGCPTRSSRTAHPPPLPLPLPPKPPRLDDDGFLWEPEEEDPTAERECTSPFHLAPFTGKYSIDYAQDLDGVRVQVGWVGWVGWGGGGGVGGWDGGFGGVVLDSNRLLSLHVGPAHAAPVRCAFSDRQKILCGMRDRGATAAVVEASTEAIARRWLEVRRPAGGLGGCSDVRGRGPGARSSPPLHPLTPPPLTPPRDRQYVDVDVAVWTNFEEEPRHLALHGSAEVGGRGRHSHSPSGCLGL